MKIRKLKLPTGAVMEFEHLYEDDEWNDEDIAFANLGNGFKIDLGQYGHPDDGRIYRVEVIVDVDVDGPDLGWESLELNEEESIAKTWQEAAVKFEKLAEIYSKAVINNGKKELEQAIKKHRDGAGQDRCWENDCELASMCNLESPVRPTDNPIEWMKNCIKYAGSVLGFDPNDYEIVKKGKL